MWLIAMIVGCGGGPAECGPAECADICAETPAPEAPAPDMGTEPEPAGGDGLAMSDYESEMLGPLLEDLREGVRPYGPEGIGICKGSGKDCEEYLGTEVTDPLPEGEYMLKAELAVPRTGEKGTWSVKFDLDCTTVKKTENSETTSNSTKSKSYDVIYAGDDRGYRLMPLWTIKSPNKYGEQTCKYTITGPHPDGDKVYEGQWVVPQAE